jgi:methionyl-tRNA formyltransferase
MKLVFFGSGAFGVPTLRRLPLLHELVAVVTQPPRPSGRGRRPASTPVAEEAARLGGPLLMPQDVNDPATIADLGRLGAQAYVVVAYGQKLSEALLQQALAINLHASLLPRYRGAAPVAWAIINGESETGVSVIRMTPRIDAGEVLARRATRIDPRETAGELEQRLSELGVDPVLETLDRHSRGELRPVPQDERLACGAPRLSKADGTVRFDQPATVVRNRVHGLTPWPGCRVFLDGSPLRLARVEVVGGRVVEGSRKAPETAGEVTPEGLVGCSPGTLRLLEVQPPGGTLMSFEAYSRGHPIPCGARMRPL